MKRGSLFTIICLSLICILLFAPVSAGWFGDFWEKITGRAIDGTCIGTLDSFSLIYYCEDYEDVIDAEASCTAAPECEWENGDCNPISTSCSYWNDNQAVCELLEKFGCTWQVARGEIIGWTAWYDRDNPSGTGDYEPIELLYSEHPREMCENPTAIECKTISGNDYTTTGQTVVCNLNYGFYCRNVDNPGDYCKDYKVRFYCGEGEPPEPPEESIESICDDNIDNDGDGYIDCKDADCVGNLDSSNKMCCQVDDDCEHYSVGNTCYSYVDECYNNYCEYDLEDTNKLCSESICTRKDGWDNSACVEGGIQPVCGNGILETGEECDDGNLIDGDGCSSICESEKYHYKINLGETINVGGKDILFYHISTENKAGIDDGETSFYLGINENIFISDISFKLIELNTGDNYIILEVFPFTQTCSNVNDCKNYYEYKLELNKPINFLGDSYTLTSVNQDSVIINRENYLGGYNYDININLNELIDVLGGYDIRFEVLILQVIEINNEEQYAIVRFATKGIEMLRYYFLAFDSPLVFDEFSGKWIVLVSRDYSSNTANIDVTDLEPDLSLYEGGGEEGTLIEDGESININNLMIRLSLANAGEGVYVYVGEDPTENSIFYFCQDNNVILNSKRIDYNCIENKCSMELAEFEEVQESCNSGEFCIEGIKCCMFSSLPEKNFPIGIYVPSLDRLDLVQELGVNTVIDNTVLLGTPHQQLEKAQEYDFNVIVNYKGNLRAIDIDKRQFLKQAINDYCTSPYYSNLYRFYLRDEPIIEEIEGLEKTASILEEFNPSHPGISSWNKPWLYKEFMSVVHPNELLGHFYPIFFNTPTSGDEFQRRLEVFNSNLRMARDATMNKGISFWPIIQVHSWSFGGQCTGNIITPINCADTYGNDKDGCIAQLVCEPEYYEGVFGDCNKALCSKWNNNEATCGLTADTGVTGCIFERKGTNLREPIPTEIREMVYLALAHGAKGIFYFLYKTMPEYQAIGLVDENGNPNEKYYEVQEINNELEILTPLLLELESTGVCNSNIISSHTHENLLNHPEKWGFNDWGAEATTTFSSNKLIIDLNRQTVNDNWFDFWYNEEINTRDFNYLQVKYKILSNPGLNTSFRFNPTREDGGMDNDPMISSIGEHSYIINLEYHKGENICRTYRNCLNPDITWQTCGGDCNTCKCESDVINKLGFFIQAYNPGDSMKIEIDEIKRATCILPNIKSVTGNIEVGTFRDDSNNQYIMLVNRDTNNPVTTTIELSIIANRLVDMFTGEELIISEYSGSYTISAIHPASDSAININLDEGDGKLFKIEKTSGSLFDRFIDFIKNIF